MLIIALLGLVAYSQQYQTHPSLYSFTTREAAADACVDIGLQLCSSEQLYSVVFGTSDYEVPDLCKTGWTSTVTGDYQLGWWNNDADSCARHVGWNSWLPAHGSYGAHCCSDDVPESTPATCATMGDCSGEKIFVDGFESVWCPDGICTEDLCCHEWQPAPRHSTVPDRWGYIYTSGEEADVACQAANEDWLLCTFEQIVGIAADGTSSCGSGWFKCNELHAGCDDGYMRGSYVTEQDAADAACGSLPGFRAWVPADGTGAAHCCSPSYVKSSYGSLAEGGNDLAAAEAYCSTTSYTPNVCLQPQLETVALTEDTNICRSAFYKETEDDTTGITGWFQTDDSCGGGTGWKTWAHPNPGAHCCAEYVLVPDLGEWTYTPETYGAGFASGAAAADRCTTTGYDSLCTINQMVHIGTNVKTDMCLVGWAIDSSGGYDAGYFRTDPGCGTSNAWNNEWTPATPVAFCCMDSVPEIELSTPAYYNGNWDYSYATMEAAAAKCTGDFSLCSEDQIYTIAVHGVTYPDDADFQQEPAICRLAWTSDNTKMWWQGDDTSCGASGYRTYGSANTLAGYHCCKDFPSRSAEPTTTTLGTFEAFTKAHPSYIFYSEQEAKDACTALHPQFQLCSSSQVVEVALNGAQDDGTFLEVSVQNEICFTSWVDTDRAVCNPAKDVGFYRVLAGCGSGGFQWSDYRPTNPTRAGAYCCAPSIVPSQEYLVELDCAPETTLPPSVAPQETLYHSLSDNVCSELSINDCSSVYTRDNQYFFSDDGGVSFQPTCVAYSSVEEAQCDYTAFVCAGVLRRIYGSLTDQGVILAQAMSQADNMHTACPPESCSAYAGYSPEDFAAVVNYCRGDDGCYYMNGMETCVCDVDGNVATELQNLWESTFELSSCSDPRTFDEIMNDQLFITNQMISDLEEQVESIPDVNTQLQNAQGELQTIWINWETEITATINAAIATAQNDGNQELVDSLNGIITSLTDLSSSN